MKLILFSIFLFISTYSFGKISIILTNEGVRKELKLAEAIFEHGQVEVEEAVQRKFIHDIEIVLCDEEKVFYSFLGYKNHLINGFVREGEYRIFLNYFKLRSNILLLKSTFKHELIHVLFNELPVNPELFVPRWFEEGFAEYISEGITDKLFQNGDKLLSDAVLGGSLLSFTSLEQFFPIFQNELILAYKQSASFTEYLFLSREEINYQEFFDLFKTKKNFYELLSDFFNKPYFYLFSDWKEELRRKYGMFYYISSNITLFLFFLGALVLFMGYLKKREAFKRRLKEMEEEEKL